MNYNKQKTVIVYLAMNTKKDATYGRDSRSMLEKSLDTLYKCYNDQFKHDIIIFYDNKAPFLDKDQMEIKKWRKEISFRLLSGNLWSPPICDEIKRRPDPKSWIAPHFSVGYRNMRRWYGILIYKYLTDLGYEWYMRMDDDSLLHSVINYDLFKFMYDNNYEYVNYIYNRNNEKKYEVPIIKNSNLKTCFRKTQNTPPFASIDNNKNGNKYG
jgi:alpha 1,2-mannosyltransferase